jgi:hypothetical protein
MRKDAAWHAAVISTGYVDCFPRRNSMDFKELPDLVGATVITHQQ